MVASGVHSACQIDEFIIFVAGGMQGNTRDWVWAMSSSEGTCEESSQLYRNVCQAEKAHFHLSTEEMVPTGGYL